MKKTVYDDKTNAKLEALKKQYKDKSLSREERAEALKEIARVTYAADPRPAVSVRKQAVTNAVLFFLDALVFGFIAVTDRAFRDSSAGNTLSIVLFSVMLIFIVFFVIRTSRYKNEPDDELSRENKRKASLNAFLTLLIVVAVVGLVWFDILEKTFTLDSRNWLGFFCCLVFAYSGLSNAIFLYIDGKGETEEEE